MLLFAEVVFESFPGGGPLSVVRDGVGLAARGRSRFSCPWLIDRHPPMGRNRFGPYPTGAVSRDSRPDMSRSK